MTFFEDFKISERSSIGITNLLSNITTREGSHKGGWARLLKCQLKNLGYDRVKILDNSDYLGQFDIIIFDLGAEYSGALNLFGGLDEKVFNRLRQIADYKGRLFSWKNELPDVSVLESRRTNASTCEQFKLSPGDFLGRVREALSNTIVFNHVIRTSSLLIGDSHTPSVWTPEFMIERRDGRTLKGMIENETIKRYSQLFQIDMGMTLDEVKIHCSSIDIRHHLARESDPELATVHLANGLIKKACQLSDQKLSFVHTMGIEDESRDLPKTGYFKGTPFFGSWELRNKLRNLFNSTLDQYCSTDENTQVIHFPKYFFDESGKLKFEVMEKPQSVHLSPEHYCWDLDHNRRRW